LTGQGWSCHYGILNKCIDESFGGESDNNRRLTIGLNKEQNQELRIGYRGMCKDTRQQIQEKRLQILKKTLAEWAKDSKKVCFGRLVNFAEFNEGGVITNKGIEIVKDQRVNYASVNDRGLGNKSNLNKVNPFSDANVRIGAGSNNLSGNQEIPLLL